MHGRLRKDRDDVKIPSFEKFKSFCDPPILDLIMFVRFTVSQACYTQNSLVISYWARKKDGRLLLFPCVNEQSRFKKVSVRLKSKRTE